MQQFQFTVTRKVTSYFSVRVTSNALLFEVTSPALALGLILTSSRHVIPKTKLL